MRLLASHALVALFLVFVTGCSEDPAQLDTQLSPTNNVVASTSEPFVPAHGGIGLGKASLGPSGSTVPTVTLVLSEVTMPRVGEDACGQWQIDSKNDLEVRLYGALAPGTYEIVEASTEGKAVLSFRGRSWQRGDLVIEEGTEARGSTTRGTIDATDRDGVRLQLRFEMLVHGCGRS